MTRLTGMPRRPAVRLLRSLAAVSRPPARAVVTVGVFDGVHQGHQRILRTAIRHARRVRGTSVVVTFDPDPQHVLDPAHEHPALMPLAERLRYLAEAGVAWILVIPFTRRFARLTAAGFVHRVLLARLHAQVVVVGERFQFGRRREGDVATLQRWAAAHGIQVLSVPDVRQDGAAVSSSRIRRLIRRGALAQARALLGRPPALYGRVGPGAGRGRGLGFPTANIALIDQVLPPHGVYAVIIERPGTRWRRPGVMNFGVRPTFGGGPVVCEVHVLGFSGSLRGAQVKVQLLARLRSERRFPSSLALRRQIQHDVQRARRLMTRLSLSDR